MVETRLHYARTRRREAASLATHYVAGVLDRGSMANGIELLGKASDLKPGDRVRTLKGSRKGCRAPYPARRTQN